MNKIDKDTKIYGSFSTNPGNNGCIFFNNAFETYGINAIYKSFYADNLLKTIEAVKTLQFSGFAISMPFKVDILKYLDDSEGAVTVIGAANTVVVGKDGYLTGYNTDYLGVMDYFAENKINGKINVIGTGGFSKAIQYACKLMDIKCTVYTRHEISQISHVKDEIFINATPADIESDQNKIIDARPFAEEGKYIASYQAKRQFKIYTGINYVWE